MIIRIQAEDFDVGAVNRELLAGRSDVGAIASFIGLVRDIAGDPLQQMTLEHYPGMTEKMLGTIEAEALARWPLDASLLIHRYGRLEPGERIVFVLTASAHRAAAYEANMFLIDWLKTKAPFWKQEDGAAGAKWVTARDSDDSAAERWSSKTPAKAAE